MCHKSYETERGGGGGGQKGSLELNMMLIKEDGEIHRKTNPLKCFNLFQPSFKNGFLLDVKPD